MSKTLPFPQGGAGDGAPPPGPATPLPAGTEVAHLVIDRVLHEGPHNIVYLAHDGMADDLAGVVAASPAAPPAILPSAPPVTEVATKPATPTVSASRATPTAPVPPALPPVARRDTTTVASAAPPVERSSAPPSARPPAAVPCAKASGFALAYCLQEECAKPSNRAHPRCVAWRRSAEAAR